MPPGIFVTQPIPEPALARLREAGNVEMNPDPLHIATKPELKHLAYAQGNHMVGFISLRWGREGR